MLGCIHSCLEMHVGPKAIAEEWNYICPFKYIVFLNVTFHLQISFWRM